MTRAPSDGGTSRRRSGGRAGRGRRRGRPMRARGSAAHSRRRPTRVPRRRRAPFGPRGRQGGRGRFAPLAADDPVDVRRAEDRLWPERRERAAPDNRDTGETRLQGLRDRNRRDQLRTRHDGHRQAGDRIHAPEPRLDFGGRLGERVRIGEVPVQDPPRRPIGEGRAEGHDGERETPVLRSRGPGIEKQYHPVAIIRRRPRGRTATAAARERSARRPRSS